MNGRFPAAVAIVALFALAACRREAQAPLAQLAPLERDGRMEWAGMQPCADCDGIQTRLVLARDGGDRGFVLTETFLAAQPVRFVARGSWERDGALLRLHAQDGARYGYVVLADGGLQPRDMRGHRLATSDGDGLLLPLDDAAATAAR